MFLHSGRYLFPAFFLLLEIIIWEYGEANGSEIKRRANVGVLRYSDIQNREIQKRASGLTKPSTIPVVSSSQNDFGYKKAIPGRSAQTPIGGHYYYGALGKGGIVAGQLGMPTDFNPAIRGYRGNPGIKIRINRRAFQYISTLVGQILNQQITRFRIPDIQQTIQEICAEIAVCNIHVSNYRPPQCLNIYPSPPNHIVLSIEDFDIGVAGNLNGMANIILPIQIFGIVHVNFYHVSATITLRLERSIYGSLRMVLSGCNIKIPYADVCIENGGLLGELANLLFRQDITGRVRDMAPAEICKRLPEVIEGQINPLLTRIPQSIPFTQLANLFTGFLGQSIPPHCYLPQCQGRSAAAKLAPGTNGANSLPPRNPPLPPTLMQHSNKTVNTVAKIAASTPIQVVQPKLSNNVGEKGKKTQLFRTISESQMVNSESSTIREINSSNGLMRGSDPRYLNQEPTQKVLKSIAHTFSRTKRGTKEFESLSSNIRNDIMDWSRNLQLPSIQQSQQTVVFHLLPKELYQWHQNQQKSWQQQQRQQQGQKSAQKLPPPSSAFREQNSKTVATSVPHVRTSSNQFNRSALSIRGVPVVTPIIKGYGGIPNDYKSGIYQPVGAVGDFRGRISDPCAGCPLGGTSDSFGALGSLIRQQLDLRKVANLVLTIQLLRSYATFYDYNIDLNGEFSPNGRGGTPFGPFPMQWPTSVGSPMIEILISDFTINSLLYWMHRTNFLSFRIGPETPNIGPLLTTTCDISNDYTGEELENEPLFVRLLRLSQHRRRYHLHQQRSKRQAITDGDSNLGNLGDLADLGICLGDILPVIKEKYPNRTLALVIHTARAPSIIISRRGGGSVQLDLAAFVDIYLDKTNIRVGTISATAVADIMIRIIGQRIVANASLPVLRLTNPDQTLGLQQEAFDNLASLANDIILKAANEQLNRGMEISLPTSNLPFTIIRPNIQILEHSIYIGSDFAISPSALRLLS